ncbi:hypothetical protein [Sphingomonas sp. Leaf4]|uniref:hypothetical protein n=1 Tax=Sphingomonas sp. Leaf4 TaxID=2876553 RepID=UPI001E2D74FC|nr:hypothetical protein [Sphingomonas sp. Leaf4]
MLRSIATVLGAMVWLSATVEPSCADSWELPEVMTYPSANGRARMIVTPRDLDSQLAYFEDMVDGKATPGQREDGSKAARARVETIQGGQWRVVWDRPIPNGVAPVKAIVRDDGRYAATFDDWHGTGYGPNAVVLYGPDGKVVRRLSLGDVLPAFYVDALPHSVSSIDWRGVPRFSDNGSRIMLPIVIPEHGYVRDARTVDLTIRVSDGAASFADAWDWGRARTAGCRVYRAKLAAEAEHKAAFLAPLRRPTINDERSWHDYLNEARARRFGDGRSSWTTVLRKPDAPDYAVSEGWVRERLTDPTMGDAAFATLSEEHLVAVVRRIAASVPAWRMRGTTLYFAVSADRWSAIEAALRHTGATLVQFDPDVSIAQRRDRIASRYGA